MYHEVMEHLILKKEELIIRCTLVYFDMFIMVWAGSGISRKVEREAENDDN